MTDFRELSDVWEIKSELEKLIKSDYIDIPTKDIYNLQENDEGCTYELSIKLGSEAKNEILVLKNLETLKKSSMMYINERKSLTKDCDGILIDFKRKTLVFIEMKWKNTLPASSVYEQLKSGRKWFEHIMFCSKLSMELFSDWYVRNLYVVVGAEKKSISSRMRQDKSLFPHCTGYNGLYSYSGSILVYSQMLTKTDEKKVRYKELISE